MPAPKDPQKYAEWRANLKKAKVGFVPWNKGRKISEESEFDEYRQHMSEAQLARGPSSYPRGYHLSDDHKQKLSTAGKGKRRGFANGHKHSEATKQKMRKTKREKPQKREGPMPQAQRDKISETLRTGYQAHPEWRIRGPISEGRRAKQSESMKRYFQTEEGLKLKALLSQLVTERQTGKPLSEEHKAAISKANRETFSDPEIRAELSERSEAMWQDPDVRTRMLESMRSEESRAKKSEASKVRWEDANYREHMSEVLSDLMTERWADPEARAVLLAANASEESRSKKSKAHKERWADPEIGPKQLARLLSYCTDHTRYKRGWHFSPKTGDLHRFRSSYELRAYQKLDQDPNVALYITEPCVIPYTFDGRQRRYVVDLYVEFIDGSWQLIEIKPAYALSHPTVQAKLEAAKRIYSIEHFTCWTEEQLVV